MRKQLKHQAGRRREIVFLGLCKGSGLSLLLGSMRQPFQMAIIGEELARYWKRELFTTASACTSRTSLLTSRAGQDIVSLLMLKKIQLPA